ncbi:MAG: S8 family serine peptidase [Bacteroidota bacterium]|nr:S8 family serine peptidase [Bacteroidota bacterium]
MRKILSIFAFFTIISGYSQVAPDKYFIEFTDKSGTPYSIDKPREFLSQRAIDRRNREYLAITEDDLPVNPQYINQIAATGVQVLTVTKWFNGVTVYTPMPSLIDSIEKLPFVKKVIKNKGISFSSSPVVDKFRIENLVTEPLQPSTVPLNPSNGFRYGVSYNQIHMLNGDGLHSMGYRGNGKVIAILDGGFYKVDKFHAFDSLWARGQILGTRDFVTPGGNIFIGASHGMSVLSTMGGNIPDSLIGTAPMAKYWLLRSEDVNSEYIIEEYNWVSAAEFADSVGADVINSSLGYSTFNDSSQNHTCDDMNGYTTPVSRGANMAGQRGIAVVCSAGNEGGSEYWHCVSAPADATEVLAIAAVDSSRNYAWFSSHGRIDTTYVKPNVAAQGEDAIIYSTFGRISTGSGTSFSSPIMAGLVACLWQAMPQIDHFHLLRAIEKSADHYATPDTLTGYGIPNFVKALQILSVNDKKTEALTIWPNPFSNDIFLHIHSGMAGEGEVFFYDEMGKIVFQKNIQLTSGENNIRIDGLDDLHPGFYILHFLSSGVSASVSLVKIK